MKIDKAEFLEQAADVVRVNGLHKHELWPGCSGHSYGAAVLSGRVPSTYQPGSPVCAWGALYVTGCALLADETPEVKLAEIQEVGSELCDHLSQEGARLLSEWNDDPERIGDEVVEMFLGYAKQLRNGATSGLCPDCHRPTPWPCSGNCGGNFR